MTTCPKSGKLSVVGPTGKQRDILRGRSGGMCEICGIAPATNWHHRKNRSQGGKDDLANALHLDGSGTTGCHGHVTDHPAEAYEKGWSVRSGFNPADVPVLLAGRWVLLTNSGHIFTPPAGRDRCPRCGFDMPTQGHRDGCNYQEGTD